MQRTIVIAAGISGLLGCGPNPQITAKYQARVEEARQIALTLVVNPVCEPGTQDAPRARCGLITDELGREDARAAFIVNVCHEDVPAGQEPSAECRSSWWRMIRWQVGHRYPDADYTEVSDWCNARPNDCFNLRVLELHLLNSHNAGVVARYQAVRDGLHAQHDAEQDADSQQQRAALRAVGAGMQGFSQGLAAAPTESQASLACTSDYACGAGFVCVKPQGKMSGTCARSVNDYGNPTFVSPRSSSLGPGEGNCSFDTDCGTGFRCEKPNGAVRGNCLR